MAISIRSARRTVIRLTCRNAVSIALNISPAAPHSAMQAHGAITPPMPFTQSCRQMRQNIGNDSESGASNSQALTPNFRIRT
jgi:hypothetical protein